MAKPLLPPSYVNVPAGILYSKDLPAAVIHTYCQLKGLGWGRDGFQEIPFKYLEEVTGKSRSTLYGHIGTLKTKGWLLFNTIHRTGLSIWFTQPGDSDEKVGTHVSINLESLNEEVFNKEIFNDLNLEEELPPDFNDSSLRPVPSRNPDRQSRIPDTCEDGVKLFDQALRRKLEDLAMYPGVVKAMEAIAARDGWTLEQLHLLADQLIRDKGMQSAGQLFTYRIKNKIKPKTAQDKAEAERKRWAKSKEYLDSLMKDGQISRGMPEKEPHYE
jgi:hypothetical protein